MSIIENNKEFTKALEELVEFLLPDDDEFDVEKYITEIILPFKKKLGDLSGALAIRLLIKQFKDHPELLK